jgi:iron complex transport system substrate-binding protein
LKKINQPLTKTQYVLVGVVLFLLIFSFSVFALAVTADDDRGVAMVFDKPPQRIVSLIPSITESVCALGKCAALVGVDRFSNWPKSIQGLPKLGSMGDVNIERIVQLKPDLVLLEKASPVIARFNSLGIQTFALDIKSMADEERALQKLDIVLAYGIRFKRK